MFKSIFSNRFFLIFIFSFISILLFFILSSVNKFENNFEKKVFEIATVDIIQIVKNTSKSIASKLNDSSNYINKIKKSTSLQKDIEDEISLLITNNIKYVYLLYKDEKGIYRFLADGAKKGEKAFINQKFDVESSKWDDVYISKKTVLIKQPLLHQLSVTFIEPILNNNEVELLLVLDFSIDKAKDINEVIILVKDIIIAINIGIIFFILILIIQTIKYYSINKIAYVDSLTNVYNRNYLQRNENKINLEDYTLAVLDIDYFKKINDTFGHQVGDLILKDVGSIMLESIRLKDDIIIRYGGEEFIILSKKQYTDEDNNLSAINRIFNKIRNNTFNVLKNKKIKVTVSMGINLEPHKSKSFKEAFRLADDALYQAKQDGRDRIVIHE